KFEIAQRLANQFRLRRQHDLGDTELLQGLGARPRFEGSNSASRKAWMIWRACSFSAATKMVSSISNTDSGSAGRNCRLPCGSLSKPTRTAPRSSYNCFVCATDRWISGEPAGTRNRCPEDYLPGCWRE